MSTGYNHAMDAALGGWLLAEPEESAMTEEQERERALQEARSAFLECVEEWDRGERLGVLVKLQKLQPLLQRALAELTHAGQPEQEPERETGGERDE